MIHKEQFRIRTSECDANMKIQPKAVLDLFQEVAARDCERYNLDSPALIKSYNTGWILSGTAIEFKKHPSWPEILNVKTWVKNLSGIKATREYSILNDAGDTLINGSGTWALLDLKTRRPVRITDVTSDIKVNTGIHALDIKPGRVKITEDDTFCNTEILVTSGDIDMNGHVCNIQYLGWLHHNMDKEFIKKHELSSVNIAYLGESYLGETLIYKYAIKDKQGSHIFYNKISGKEVCKISSEWRELGS